ncbi:PREDICTED: uncharacterized protein LOC105146970 [Acromyrmex echinatior]|uniref:uncharacterized protein LOC105146970 n=1 Tax=Acromyrmex echinatior TaxID=103372 RepID=UPI000580D12D|nr:PREDICTED: uncharacterized protein LOC105146970 [Acromyrmex echinatior]
MSDRKSMFSKTEKAFILQCIKVYRSLPALWDIKSKDYRNRRKKNDAYAILINKYREKYPKATRKDIIRKFYLLRTNFRKELKRINDAKRNGTDVEKPTLWYFKEMHFLQEIIQNSRSTIDQFKKTEENNSVINMTQIYKENENRKEIKKDNTCQIKEKITIEKRKKNAQDEHTGFACECLKSNENEYDKIAKAWAIELPKMSREQQIYAKKAINDILFEGQLGNLHRNSVQIDPLIISRTFTPIYNSDSI